MTDLLCLVGPTAAGKTRMGVEVALALRSIDLDVEIVSCDSMAVYRSLDVVADKPSADERRGVVHHLFDVVDPSEPFTAIAYRDLARAAIKDIHDRGGVPLLVGGSGLYFRAVVDDLEFAPTSAGVRARLEHEPSDRLIERLRIADPATANRLDPRNKRRLVRAVEVLELTGRPPSELRNAWDRRSGPYEVTVAGLTWDREVLLRRATERVHRELQAGLVQEVRAIGSERLSQTARQALGVKEILPVLDGTATLEEATEQLVRNTKRFVRRQLSWFKADPRVWWTNASEAGWEGAREKIAERFAVELDGELEAPAAGPPAPTAEAAGGAQPDAGAGSGAELEGEKQAG
ncbi:MAG: tRNA (adenosine(37)-N6)-dimethylallyltransferase MiaA [Actinomycetota bacterium]